MACNKPHGDDFGAGLPGKKSLQITLSVARTMRERRNAFFDSELFSDPAWDILLLLANGSHRTGFTAAEIATTLDYPPSIAGRWLKILASKGQVEPYPGVGLDQPLYRLSQAAFAAMVDLFAGIVDENGELAA